MLKNGAYLINAAQVKQLEDVVLVWSKPKKRGRTDQNGVINKDWVGRDAKKILAQIGINVGDDIRCIICETEFSQAFVQTELMMPILPIVRVDTFDEAVEMAVKAEHGNRHSAHLHSKNVDHMTQYAKAICTTIFVKNARHMQVSALTLKVGQPLLLPVRQVRVSLLREVLHVREDAYFRRT